MLHSLSPEFSVRLNISDAYRSMIPTSTPELLRELPCSLLFLTLADQLVLRIGKTSLGDGITHEQIY